LRQERIFFALEIKARAGLFGGVALSPRCCNILLTPAAPWQIRSVEGLSFNAVAQSCQKDFVYLPTLRPCASAAKMDNPFCRIRGQQNYFINIVVPGAGWRTALKTY
jgi:hypothetical protein